MEEIHEKDKSQKSRLDCDIQDIISYILQNIKCPMTICYVERMSNGERNLLGIFHDNFIHNIVFRNPCSLVFEFKKSGFHNINSIFVKNLRHVSIYDSFGEFRSLSSLEILYSLKNNKQFSILQKVGIIKEHLPLFQWNYYDEKLEAQLDNLGKTILYDIDEDIVPLDFRGL